VDLAAYIDQRLSQISRSGAAYNDAHLMVLTALVLADELFDAREGVKPAKAAGQAVAPAASREDEQALVRLLDQITKRIDGIAQRLQAA
jgi:cell division protein ZapA